jgi:hypothetical protein
LFSWYKVWAPNRQQTALQSIAVNTLVNPINPNTGSEDTDVYHKIDNSLIQNYLEGDSYMAKVSGGGMTNARALQVLAKIERKLVGYNGPTERPLAVKKQVQDLIGEATDIENLSQGMSFHCPSPLHTFLILDAWDWQVEELTDRLCTRLDAFLVIPYMTGTWSALGEWARNGWGQEKPEQKYQSWSPI